MADVGSPTRQGKKGLSRFVGVNAAPAPLPAVPPRPQGDLTRACAEEVAAAIRTTWPTNLADNRWRRSRGARDVLRHLEGFPGQTWQQRWEASGLNEAGRPVSALQPTRRGRSQLGVGAACLFCLRIIRPSLAAFRSNTFLYYGQRFLTAQNDPLLERFWAQAQDAPVNPVHHATALFDVAVALTTQGITLADLSPAAFLHYAWQCRRQGLVLGQRGAGSRFPGHLAWQVLHAMGHFPSQGPATLKAALLTGRLTVQEMVDRYKVRHAGVRQLLIAYLERRSPELDYSTLDNLSRHLTSHFWVTIEQLAPDQPDLRIGAELYQRWRDQAAVRTDGHGRRNLEPVLRAIRAFYADLQAWAAAEPEQWAIWVAPCPITNADVRGYGIRRRRVKERMDDRTRQRQPLLRTLVEHMENRYGHLRELLHQAADTAGGEIVSCHHDINVTLGYKAVYPDEAIQAHLAFLARRRGQRPGEEYRVPTDTEWEQFLGHWERRKVSTGLCGRAYSTPCIHEHACLRCSMHWPDPTQRNRIVDIRDNLQARIAEAEREGWLGEVEGLQISLAGANDKLTQIDKRTPRDPVALGMPTRPAEL